MTKIRERAFAWVGIIIFTVSALALSAAVIIQQVMSNSSSSTSQNCTDNAVEPTLSPPSPYIPKTAVTSLQTIDLTAGKGQAAQAGDCLVVKYYGTLASTGMAFDENFTKTTGFAFTVGEGQVIQGWDQGLIGMKAGGTRLLVIPPSLAYGNQANGSIPANSTLVFVVKLLRIQS
jgi:FKBP-type peptidyl-prolyl cis-trans isomerase